MTGMAYVIEKLGATCAYLEGVVAERDAALQQAAERIARLEAEVETHRST